MSHLVYFDKNGSPATEDLKAFDRATFASGTIQRTNDKISGAEVITGLGFTPSIVHFFAIDDQANANRSSGWSVTGIDVSQSGFGGNISKSIDVIGNGNGWTSNVQSFDLNGFTLNWTKVGTGLNITVKYLALK